MAADKSDEPGVLGNLPRSRPGVRSNKRRGGSGDGGTAAATTTRASVAKPKPKPKPAAAKPKAAQRPRPAPTPAAEKPQPGAERHDPLSEAVRLAGKVAETGLKTVGGILRRLPGR